LGSGASKSVLSAQARRAFALCEVRLLAYRYVRLCRLGDEGKSERIRLFVRVQTIGSRVRDRMGLVEEFWRCVRGNPHYVQERVGRYLGTD